MNRKKIIRVLSLVLALVMLIGAITPIITNAGAGMSGGMQKDGSGKRDRNPSKNPNNKPSQPDSKPPPKDPPKDPPADDPSDGNSGIRWDPEWTKMPNFDDEERDQPDSEDLTEDEFIDTNADIETKPKDNVYNEKKGDLYGLPMDETGRLYGNPKQFMSKTAFIMELMKTEEVIPGVLLMNRVEYERIDNDAIRRQIKIEPVETSPYQEYMGTMGIDTGQTDVIISHEIFGIVLVASNSNVAELYLSKAYQKGLFNLTELNKDHAPADGKELREFLGIFYSKDYGASDVVPRWDYHEEPMKIGFKKVRVSDKVIEEDNAAAQQYPQQYFKKWREIVTDVSDWEPKSDFMDNTKFWGNMYYYVPIETYNERGNNYEKITLEDVYTDEQHKELNDWFNTEQFAVIRRPSSLEDPVNGYKFFNDESMTVLDAYMMVYKQLLSSEGEQKLTKAEVDYINSAYQMNMANFLPDEVEAVKYLIAMGIIDGEDLNLYQAAHMPLTNRVAIDLLYRVYDKGSRIKFVPELNDIQSAMVGKGYSQVEISVGDTKTPIIPAYLEEPDIQNDDNAQAEGFDTVKDFDNNYAYSYIFMRMPKGPEKEGGGHEKVNYSLRINDEYRTPLKGHEFREGGPEGPVILDGRGYEWRLYTVHKDTTTDLILTGISEDTNTSYTIGGINGPGLYWLPDDDQTQNLQKWSINEFLTKSPPRAFITNGEQDTKLYEQMKSTLELRKSIAPLPEYKRGETAGDVVKSFDPRVKVASKLPETPEPFKISSETLENSGMGLSDFLGQMELYNYLAENADPTGGMEVKTASYTRPTYGEEKNRREIVYGPITEDQLYTLRYGEDNLLGKGQDGNPAINADNSLLKMQNFTDKYKIQKVESEDGKAKYEIRWEPTTADYKNELAKFTRHLSRQDVDEKAKFPGFAKLEDNEGNPTVLISKAQLQELGIETLSDKLLYNPRTGQRAFINTDDHMTLIGNNITHYSEGSMMVNAFGAVGDHDKPEAARNIFYNIDIALELLNDSKLTEKVAGKTIYIAKEGGTFEEINVINRETQPTNVRNKDEDLFVDRTYIYNLDGVDSGSSKRVYVNLSALTGMTSNFIYYKNKQTTASTVDALIVYHPRDEYNQYLGTTDNRITTQMIKGGDDEDTLKIKDVGDDIKKASAEDAKRYTELTNERMEAEKTKAYVLSKLFLGATDKPEDIMGLNYTYDIYLFEKTKSRDNGIDTLANFMAAVFGERNKEVFDSFKRISTGVGMTGEEVEEGQEDKGNPYKDLSIDVIKATITEAEGDKPNVAPVNADEIKMSDYDNNFLIQEGTGNLYFYVGNSDGQHAARQSTLYRRIFGQNLYYEHGEDPRLGFRMRHYYQNTPKNFIPLERYADGTESYGGMFISGARIMNNFEVPYGKDVNKYPSLREYKRPYKFPFGHRTNGQVVANNNVSIINGDKGKEEVGLYTKLELPFEELKFDFNNAKRTGMLGNNSYDKNARVTNWDSVNIKEAFKNPKEKLDPEKSNYSNYSEQEPTTVSPPPLRQAELSLSADKDNITEALFGHTLAVFSEELNKSDRTLGNADTFYFDPISSFSKIPMDMKLDTSFQRDLMQGTWDALISNLTTYSLKDSNSDWEGKGIKVNEGEEEIIVLTTGTSTMLKSLQINNSLKKGSLYAVKLPVGDSVKLREILDTNRFFTSNFKEIKVLDNLREFSKDGKIRIFYKPSLAIPQGTNVVDPDGRIRTLRNPLPREEVPYAADIINSLLFRITLNNPKYDNKTFLYQIPEGSVVDFGSDGTYLIKTSPKQTDDKLLKWVSVVNSPKSSTLSSMYQAEDFIVMSDFLTKIGNRVTIGYNMTGAKVPLKSIMGKGLYMMPHIDLLNNVYNSRVGEETIPKVKQHFKSDGESNDVWVRDTDTAVDEKLKIKKYDIVRARNAGDKFSLDRRNLDEKRARLMYQMYLPPTIEVQKIDDPGNMAHYKALAYYDIKGFQVDKDNTYVSYLRDRDTDAEDVLDGIYQLRTAKLDGQKYLNFARMRFGEDTANETRNAMLGIVPIVITFLVILMLSVYAILYFPEVRDVATRVAKRFSLPVGDKLEGGWLTPATLPSIYSVIWVSIALITFSILFARGDIFNIFGRIFNFVQHFFESGFKLS